MCSIRLKNVLWAFLVVALGLLSAFPASGQVFNCLPSCDSRDARFLAIANGTGLITLSEPTLDLELSVPAGTTSFSVGVFDGDSRGVDGALVPHWDTGTLGIFSYTLYADPNRNHSTATVVPLQPLLPTVLSTSMPDNAWIDFTVATDPSAKAPSGNYYYLLRIQLTVPAVTLNAFKVRTSNGQVGGSSLFPAPSPFSYIANIPSLTADAPIVYPAFPAATPTFYDGTFNFYFDEPVSQHDVTIWDGDFDRGKFDGTDLDTDDPDTPNAPFRPSWATSDTVSEGVAVGSAGTTGNPADDRNPAGTGAIYVLKPPSVRYDVIFPDLQTFANDNPSGNQEWEQFKISMDPFNRSVMDYHTPVAPPGIYRVRIQGVDMQNLNALLLPGRVLCVNAAGVPCIPLRPFLLGDTVFSDANGNGFQDPGEPGIPNVVLNLTDASGVNVGTAVTDANGHYTFEVEAFQYTVTVAGENFSSEGALASCALTTPDNCTETITNNNILTCDFGCRGAGSIGDRVWNDRNGNGVQDPGEAGINDLLVHLYDADNNEVDATLTSGDGDYIFEGKDAGDYTVVVDSAFLPNGLNPTYDLDDPTPPINTPHQASFTFLGGTKDDVDFGYQPDGSIGDRVWNDTNGNGVQDPGEPGIVGVHVLLLDANNQVYDEVTTGANGIYTFDHLIEGSYTVQIDATTLPPGVTPTYDFDGVATPHTAFVQLAGGDHRTDIDFGYGSPATASLGDRVWNDRNGDGVQDAGEPGLNGVTVELLDSTNTVMATAITSGDGNYTFSSLAAGSYSVRVVAASLPAGMAPTYDLDGIATPNIAAVTLNNGQNRTDVDFGYRGTASVGDRVWTDSNGDGVQDAGETGINGVTVELLDAGNNVVATTTTSGDGNYTFSFLDAGNYSVRVVAASLPAGVAPTYDLDGVATPNIASFSLAGGQARTDVDFGYRGTGSVGDRLWLDTNGNGIQDVGEAGINGTTVQLFSGATLLATTVTAGDGIYHFNNLGAGTYTVKVVTSTLPAGVVQTYDLDGLATPDAATFTLAAAASRDDVDFGYRGTASVGDRVWSDLNNNGIQDAGEPGINGVTLQLLDTGGNVIAATVTAGDGNYTFGNLLGGTYSVQVVPATLPAGVVPTYDLDGTGTPHIATFTLAAGASRTDVDFGYFNTVSGTSSVGDYVWFDFNGDGIQDPDEPGISGVTVELLNASNTVVGTTDTDSGGHYTFSNLAAGNYSVRVVNPGGVVPTYDLDGVGSPDIASFSLGAGESRTDVDFGYRPPATASVGDRVWDDRNGDGVQDAGEPGLSGVTVELLDSGNNVVATATTDGNGNYTFSSLYDGTYSVRVVTASLPAGMAPTYDFDGIATPNVATFTLTADQTRDDIDFGYRGTASVGDRVWTDSNGDGVQDAGETGINGVNVELLDANDNVVATTTTSGDGNYTFSFLNAGDYSVRIVTASLPAGVAPTYDLDGVATPNIASFSLAGGEARDDVDFGYRGTGSVGDRLWLDINGDGVQDPGEAGINGTTVQLFDGLGNLIATTVTAGDGIYHFNNLTAGTYSVKIVTSTLPAGVAPTYDLDGIATPDAATFTLTPDASRTDVDFGYRGTASVGDRVWRDTNSNGIQDAGEAGINGVTVELLDNGGNVIATTTTSGDGNYTFSNLLGGTYSVRVVSGTLPPGLSPTYDLDGVGTPHIASFTLNAAASRTDVDFGYGGTASVGDRLWIDSNGNGIQDAGETGLNGVTVELLDSGNTVVGSVVTSGDGNYTFSNLAGGSYSVRVVTATLPAGLAPTYDLDGVGTPNIASFTLAAAQNRTDVDFGYRGTASVGDRLWIDGNGDGIQDAGETGINGVTVELLNASNTVVGTTTTSGDGNYTFANLDSGNYSVRVVAATLPPGLAPTYDLDGIGTPNIASFSLAGGANRTDVDFGYRGTASVGDRLWIDGNGNGIQDAGETGINGVTVELLNASNTVVGTTTTSGDGNYTFSNLMSGNYSVRVVAATLPAGVAPTYDLDGIGTPNIASFSLAAGANRTDVDFGYRGTASVGDRLWLDTNADGIQDAGETGINGVTVELLNASNTVVGTATTSGDGNYTFSNLMSGNYSVRVVAATLPAGVAPSYDLDGIGTANIASFTLAAAQNRTDVDFGYRGTASVGDRVWLDTNGNGVQDSGETGINGVTVQLLNASNTVIASATTSGDGNYTFSNLTPGNYSVRVVTSSLPAGLTQTYDLDGIATANVASFSLAAGQSRTDVDFGYRGAGLVGDRVWLDTNGNGVQDAGEAGINGVTVQLLDNTNTVIATTTTAGDGNYTFSNLVAGTYSVRIVTGSLPAGVAPTYDLDGIATANIATFTLAAGANRTDVDFGYRGTASVGDRVWLDSNGNGAQDAGETGINGVTVQLLDSSNNVVGTTTTASDGNYTFSNLAAGNYSVRVVSGSLPAGLTPTFDLDGVGTPHVASFTLAAGANRTDVDFGYRGNGSVGDRVWNDANGNGVQDAGETGINGVTVQLLNSSNTVIATTTTAGDGNYTFSNLTPGTYTVRIVTGSLPAGVTPTFDLDGIATANQATFTLAAGTSRTDVDFGYRSNGSIGDRLWLDTDGDGVQDAGETGINGTTVQLLNSSNTVIATTTTAGDGNYTFSNLAPGTYTVRIVTATLPAGVVPTFDLDGVATAHQATLTLAAGASRTDVDFGYRGTASVGDRVWYDTNGNATQDAGETGINGVTVQLLDSSNNVIATTTTAGDGNYTFSNLLGGSYTVRVVSGSLPAGLSPTFDLDGIATAHQASFTLNAGASRTDVDFGYRGTASVGDRVWNDANGNGVQDAGETGLNGVTVELLSGTTVIATTTTAGNGNYTFSNLAAGTYSVRVVSSSIPAGFGPTFDLDGVGTANIATFTLTAGQARTDVDFGYRGTLSVGDRVWNDANGNGVQEASEVGLNGVSVELLSGTTVVATTTTAGNGNYSFTNLGAGTYTVRVVSATLPAGYTPTFDLDGTGTAHQATFSLTASRTDVDFGYRAPVCTAGTFKDTFTTNSFSNNEGTLSWSGAWIESDTAGTGVSTGNVTVGTPVAGYMILRDSPDTGTQPSAARQVNLTGFASATLTVDFHIRGAEAEDAAVIEVSKDGGATYTVLETLTGYTGTYISSRTYDISAYIASNTRIRFRISANFGGDDDYFKVDTVKIDANCTPQTYSIGDLVWKDTDGDGVLDAGEPGISGVTVQLLNSSNTVIGTTTTDSNGLYSFTNIAAGNYTVKVASGVPAGYAQTYDLDGIATANSASFNLTANRTDVDFGYRPATCTAGYFKDTFTTNSFSNNEGTLSWSGNWIESDTAGTGVSSGNVTVGTPVSGYMILRDSPDTGTQPSAARQVNLSGYASATLTVDFHIRGVESDDAAVIEISKDGGATYTVLETFTGLTDTYISSRTYNISAYMASNTRVRFRISANYGGDDDFFKIDAVRIDAGCSVPTYSIGDRLWKDTDGDGVQDSGEPGISGATVQLLNGSSTVIGTATTDSNGNYTFTNVAAGNYTVKVVSSSLPSGYAPTFDLDGVATPHTASFNLTANRTDVDFGYRPATCSAGYFKDTFTSNSFSNNEGTLSWSGAWIESDVAGTGVSSGNVTVGTPVSGYMILRDSPDTGTQPSAARQVNLSGFSSATLTVDFHIRGVETDDAAVIEVSKDGGATYTVLETLTGFSGTYISSRTYDISAFIASNTRIRFRINNNFGADDDYFKVDAVRIDSGCTVPGYMIGDRVWKDTDGDGVQDSGETGISNVTVQLLNSSNTVIATDTTDSNGIYGFTNIPAGTYTVKVVSSSLPSGYTPTYDLDGVSSPHTVTGPLSADHSDVDFGYKPASGGSSSTYSIGDRVWKDANANGNQDAGEAGVSGVTVQLLSGSTVVATTTTNSSGNYTFTNRAAGTYTVKIVTSSLPSNFTPTYDLDGTSSANQATFSLTANRTDVDFGYHFATSTCGGVGSYGYWKTHSDAWPVQSIVIGGVTYTKSQAINWMGTSVGGDSTISLFRQLVAAELNAISGNNASCITAKIQSADDWMALHAVGSGVSSSSSTGQAGESLATQLDSYNNGNSCAPHR